MSVKVAQAMERCCLKCVYWKPGAVEMMGAEGIYEKGYCLRVNLKERAQAKGEPILPDGEFEAKDPEFCCNQFNGG